MTSDATNAPTGMLLGYARESAGTRTLDTQIDALTGVGIAAHRVYTDHPASGPGDTRPGLIALLDYARSGDTVVVVGIDRLGRTTTEVLGTTRVLSERALGLRSLREGIDTDDPTGAMVVGVLASLARLDDERVRMRRTTSSAGHRRGSSSGRPRALSADQVELAERMRANGDAVPEIAEALGVSRATLYRALAEKQSAR